MRRLIQAVALIVLGILGALAIAEFSDFSKRHWTPGRDWIELTFLTLGTFGLIFEEFRRSWRTSSFWFVFIACLVIHCAAYAAVIGAVGQWHVTSLVGLMMIEGVGISYALKKLGYQ